MMQTAIVLGCIMLRCCGSSCRTKLGPVEGLFEVVQGTFNSLLPLNAAASNPPNSAYLRVLTQKAVCTLRKQVLRMPPLM